MDCKNLTRKIDSVLYEHTAISKKPEKLIQQEIQALRSNVTITPDLVFRDPYILDFLGLKDTYFARHSFATILKNSGVSTEFISEALGHSSLSTTKNYLTGFEEDAIKRNTDVLVSFMHESV